MDRGMTRTLRRIEVLASLEEEPDEELRRVRREAEAGDPSWRRWLDEYQSGDAMLLRLDVSVEIEEDGRSDRLTRTNRRLWVEDHAHPPKVELQVAELAPKDFEWFAAQLARRGWSLVVTDLEQMFIGVTLGDDVIERLGRERRHLGEGVDPRMGITTFAEEQSI
jgi:hypothetical protein